jgi:hypothetical protein
MLHTKGVHAMRNKMEVGPRATIAMDVLGLQARFDPIPPPPPITRTGDSMRHTNPNEIVLRLKDDEPEQKSCVSREDLARRAWDAAWRRQQFERMAEAWNNFVTEALRPKRGSRLG